MDKNIFSDLQNLGIEVDQNVDIYKKAEEKQSEAEKSQKPDTISNNKEKLHIYDKEVKCPVCEQSFKVKMVKTSSPRTIKKESDFFTVFDIINPYFYDVWLCNYCGYGSLKTDFLKIKDFQKVLITSKITPKWHGKNYPDVYDVNVAIERYKLALYSSIVIEANSSRKAMNCLKIAWMYRIIEDTENECLFIKQALDGFLDAFTNESTPIYGMDYGTLMYLIAELYRRIGDIENANVWFSKLITSNSVEQKIKEMARNQRDLIKEEEDAKAKEAALEDEQNGKSTNDSKKGFFSKLFGK